MGSNFTDAHILDQIVWHQELACKGVCLPLGIAVSHYACPVSASSETDGHIVMQKIVAKLVRKREAISTVPFASAIVYILAYLDRFCRRISQTVHTAHLLYGRNDEMQFRVKDFTEKHLDHINDIQIAPIGYSYPTAQFLREVSNCLSGQGICNVRVQEWSPSFSLCVLKERNSASI